MRIPSVNVSNVLNEEKKKQIIALGHSAGRSFELRRPRPVSPLASRADGVDPRHISKPANGSEVTTDSSGRNRRQVPRQHKRTVSLVHRKGNVAGPQRNVSSYAGKLRGGQSQEACGIIETAPGEEPQVDYGTGPMVRDAKTGKYRRTRRTRPVLRVPPIAEARAALSDKGREYFRALAFR